MGGRFTASEIISARGASGSGIARLARDIRWSYLLHEKSIRYLFAKGEL